MNMYYTDMAIDSKCTMRELYIIIIVSYNSIRMLVVYYMNFIHYLC